MVIGYGDRAATPAELEQMQALVAQAMRQGAVGVSSSLEYAPAPYASTEELIALASTAAEFGGIYATHMRSEQEAIMTALEETIRIGRDAHIPVEIWHLKAGGVKNFGLMPRDRRAHRPGAGVGRRHRRRHLRLSGLGERAVGLHSALGARRRQAPSSSSGSRIRRIRARLKKELATPATDWDNEWQSVPGPEAILISTVTNPKLRDIQGKTLADIAKTRGIDPMDTLFDILIEDDAQTYVAVFAMSEPDIELAAVQPWVSFCNDSSGTSPEGLLGKEFPHPRAYGTFPRVLRKYVREERRMRLEEAIRKFTQPAGLAPAARRPRRHQGRHVGRHRGLRSADHHRTLDLLGPQSALGRHAMGAGERRARDRRRGGHPGASRSGAPGPGFQP